MAIGELIWMRADDAPLPSLGDTNYQEGAMKTLEYIQSLAQPQPGGGASSFLVSSPFYLVFFLCGAWIFLFFFSSSLFSLLCINIYIFQSGEFITTVLAAFAIYNYIYILHLNEVLVAGEAVTALLKYVYVYIYVVTDAVTAAVKDQYIYTCYYR